MSETRPSYRIERALDPCLLAQFLPERVDYSSTAPNLSNLRLYQAARVAQHSFPEVARRLASPLCAGHDEERRWVRLWDVIEISVAADGTDLQARMLGDDPAASRCNVSVDLTRPISAYVWPGAFDAVFVEACRAVRYEPAMLPGPMGDRVRAVIGRTFRRSVAWKKLRRSVLAFLRPDPLILSLTRRIFEDSRAPVERFNWVARHVPELSLLAVEHPRLLPFLQLVARFEHGSPLANFERLMRDAGLKPSARRKLERWGWETFSQATEFTFTEDCEVTLARYANLLDRLQVEEAPHRMFTELAMRVVDLHAPDWYLRALLNEVLLLVEDLPEDPYPPDFADTATWLASGPPAPDPNQQRAGWPWICLQAWKYKRATDTRPVPAWDVPCGEFVQSGYRVIPIDNEAMLREEAMELRNCLHNMVDECVSGRIVVFSIREPLRDRRVACFALTLLGASGTWIVGQVAGKANSQVTPEIKAIARAAAIRLNEAAPNG